MGNTKYYFYIEILKIWKHIKEYITIYAFKIGNKHGLYKSLNVLNPNNAKTFRSWNS